MKSSFGRIASMMSAAAGLPSYTLGVASFAGTTTRTDFTGGLGFRFSTPSPITIHSLGRRKIAGNAGTHRVTIWDGNHGLFLAAADVDLSTGTVGHDVLTPLIADLTLPAGIYFVFSDETSGGDAWYNAAAATANSPLTIGYQAYQLGASRRDDFTGRVGFKFVPTTSQTITHLGRYKLTPSAAAAHTLYLTNTSGTVLGSVAIDTTGKPTGMVYAALTSPVTLTGGTAYYLLSSEVSGSGDPWFDSLPITLDSNFTLNASVYYDGSYHEPSSGQAWPLGFKFGSGQVGVTDMNSGLNIETAGQAYGFPQFEFY